MQPTSDNREQQARAINDEGVRHHVAQQLTAALACYQRAIELWPELPEVHCNMGVLQQHTGNLGMAKKHLNEAIRLRPDYVEALNNLGNVLRDEKCSAEAIAYYQRALLKAPEYIGAYINLGLAYMDLSRIPEAEAAYRTALQKSPGVPAVLGYLGELLERTHRIDELRQLLAEVPAEVIGTHAKLALLQAKLNRRDNRLNDALNLLENLPKTILAGSDVESETYAVLGDLYDRLGQHEAAFESFARNKAAAIRQFAFSGADKNRFLDSIKKHAEPITRDRVSQWRPLAHEPVPLVFLVGFPRSGTTLLDAVLRSHPAVDVIEEKPMLPMMLVALEKLADEQPNIVDTLDEEMLRRLRAVYLDELANYRTRDSASVIVDKLPLNLPFAGVIHRLFPEARFILALRDPRDCVLSAFMHNFAPNDAMANFQTLEDSAMLYATAMQQWKNANQIFNLEHHLIRYEDTVGSFEPTIRKLLEFLGLPWDEAVTKYQETAMARNMIRTPSYDQVVKPIYARAAGRWRNYQKQVAPVVPILQPWIEEFGYED